MECSIILPINTQKSGSIKLQLLTSVPINMLANCSVINREGRNWPGHPVLPLKRLQCPASLKDSNM